MADRMLPIPALNYDDNKNNIFKSSRSAPAFNKLKSFEKDLFDIVKDIKLNKSISNFQEKPA